ncbi:transmembrane protein 222 [Episyrphus balteatus]|uniref:transmembrane protein 222 n=1 Tax=Episyrphus balteatus TaxID=286459 RepID=UPI0024862AFB|nr:transmembrane protein 222 [Episyrphus balteatus]
MLNRTSTVSSHPSAKRKMSTPTSDSSPPPEFSTINFAADRYPYCIVWTPIPVLTWFFPFIGHMGIAMSNGVIRDFAGSYFVSEDNMAFGRPTRYLPLSLDNVVGGQYEWDEAVSKASVLYGTRMHNLFCDNCHSHVATALIGMRYKNRTNWNMIILSFWVFFRAKFVGIMGFVKTFLPFLIVVSLCVILSVYL